MNRKGYFILSLIKVIIVIAVLVFVFIKISLKLVNDANKKLAITNANTFISQVENEIQYKNVLDINYITPEVIDDYSYVRNLKGEIPSIVHLIIKDKQVSEGTLCVNGYTVIYKDGKNKVGDKCDKKLPGLYDKKDKLIVDFDSLVKFYNLNIEKNYDLKTYASYNEDGNSMYYVINNNKKLKKAVKVIIPDDVSIIGTGVFNNCNNLTSISFKNKNGWYIESLENEKIDIEVIDKNENINNLVYVYTGYIWKNNLTKESE